MTPRPSRSTRHEILQRERRLAEERGAALVLQHQKLALDRADTLLRDIAVLGCQLLGMVGNKGQHRPKILQVEQQESLLVGDAEGDVQNTFLDLVQVQQSRQQQRSHFDDGRADRMTLLAEQIPEHDGEFVGFIGEAEVLGALDECVFRVPDGSDTGQIALDVGREHRNSGTRKAFGKHLERHGLSGAGRPGDQTMPIAVVKRQILGLDALADEDFSVLIKISHWCASAKPARHIILRDSPSPL